MQLLVEGILQRVECGCVDCSAAKISLRTHVKLSLLGLVVLRSNPSSEAAPLNAAASAPAGGFTGRNSIGSSGVHMRCVQLLQQVTARGSKRAISCGLLSAAI